MKNKNGESLVSRIFTLRNMAVVFLVVYFAIFLAYPIFKAFAGSLHNWNPLIGTYDWVGLDNFKQILTDKLFWTSMGNTAVFAGVSTLFRIVLGLGLALLLSAKLVKCKDTLRGLFYMPTITPLVAVSFVWMWMFDPQFGMVNKITGLDINWLHDTKWAMPAVIIMTIWKDFGYATVLYLAGLMNLPRDVYERPPSTVPTQCRFSSKSPCRCLNQHLVHCHHVTDQLPAGIRADSRHDRRRSGHVNLHHQLSHL